MMILSIITLVLISLLMVMYRCFPIIQVVGNSMCPTYDDGEYLVGTRLYKKSDLKVGDVIVYRTPIENRVVIKRIDTIQVTRGKYYFYCLGDNSMFSHDSRNYGFVPQKNLICKILNQRNKEEIGGNDCE